MKENLKTINKVIEKIINLKDEKDIPALACEILSLLELEDKKIDSVLLAKKLGFVVVTQNLDEKLRAYCTKSKQSLKKFGVDKIICVNSNDNFYVRRYYVIVEVIHYYISKGEEKEEYYHTIEDNCVDAKERKLVSYILMPEKSFKIVYNRYSEYIYCISKVSEFFELPSEEVSYRINILN